METNGIVDKAAGHKPAKVARAAAVATGLSALLLVLINRLSNEQLFSLLSNWGGYFVISAMLAGIFYQVGSRTASALFQGAKELGGLTAATTEVSASLKEMARKDDLRGQELDHTVNILASRSETVLDHIKLMRENQHEMRQEVTEMHGMMERIVQAATGSAVRGGARDQS